jgi:hypothetical protein
VVDELEALFNVTVEVDMVVYELEELLNVTVEEVIAAVCELEELLNVTVEVDTVVYELEDLVPSDTPGDRVMVGVAVVVTVIKVVAASLAEETSNVDSGSHT